MVTRGIKPHAVEAKAFRDAIVAVHLDKVKLRCVSNKYNVPKRQVDDALYQMNLVNSIRMERGQDMMIENDERRQVHRWASRFANADVGNASTEWEKRQALLLDAQGHKLVDVYEEYGVGRTAHKSNQKLLSNWLGYKTMKDVRKAFKNKIKS